MKSMKKRIPCLLAALAVILCQCEYEKTESEPLCDNIEIEAADSLLIYYPSYGELDLVYGKDVPNGDDILFCCAGAFTASCLNQFCHDNIRCNHVSDGVLYEGSDEPVCTGVFTYYNGEGHFDFANQAALDTAAAHGGMGFEQVLVIKNDTVIYADTAKKTFWIGKEYVFRVLAEKDGRLCIAQSRKAVPYTRFVEFLKAYGIRNAINLDMGGWDHTEYTDNHGRLVRTGCKPTQYATNWIVFRRSENLAENEIEP